MTKTRCGSKLGDAVVDDQECGSRVRQLMSCASTRINTRLVYSNFCLFSVFPYPDFWISFAILGLFDLTTLSCR